MHGSLVLYVLGKNDWNVICCPEVNFPPFPNFAHVSKSESKFKQTHKQTKQKYIQKEHQKLKLNIPLYPLEIIHRTLKS
jgi:hypothetical protein